LKINELSLSQGITDNTHWGCFWHCGPSRHCTFVYVQEFCLSNSNAVRFLYVMGTV